MSHVCLAFSKLSSLIQARVVVWPSFTNGNATHSPKLPTEGPEDTGEDDDKVLYILNRVGPSTWGVISPACKRRMMLPPPKRIQSFGTQSPFEVVAAHRRALRVSHETRHSDAVRELFRSVHF